MDLSTLSKYRTQLMGVAILLVALFHSSIIRANEAIDLLCFCGDMGVDIFFFVSGFGMYYTFIKKTSMKEFYMKRSIRIIPAWFLINLFVQLWGTSLENINWMWFLKCMTGFTFWLDGNLYYWYIPSILLFYFMTPFFMKMYKKNKIKAYIGISVLWMGLLGCSLLAYNADYFIFLFRFPIYFIGILFGELSYKNTKWKKEILVGCIAVLILGILSLSFIKHYHATTWIRYDFKYFVYFVAALSFIILLCYFFEQVDYRFPILNFLGKITLEVYLLHEYILRKITGMFDGIPFDSLGIIFNILVFGITVIIAYIIHNGLTHICQITKRS